MKSIEEPVARKASMSRRRRDRRAESRRRPFDPIVNRKPHTTEPECRLPQEAREYVRHIKDVSIASLGVSRVSLGADPKRRPSPEPRQYVCRGVSKVFQRSSDFVASAIQDMMPRTPTKTKQTGFLAGWNSPSPPPRAAPRPVIAPVVPVPVVFTRTVNHRSPSPPATPRYRRSPSPPVTPRYCPSSSPARAVAVSKQQVLVTVSAPRSAVPNPTPRQLDRELATVKAKINVLEQRHVQLQAIHQQEVTRRLEGAAKAIGQGLIRAPTTIQINDNQLCLYASDEEL